MTDITLVNVTAPGGIPAFDWSIVGGDLASGDDLATAVLISLFSDATAPKELRLDDPRGWWGDVTRASPIGSRLWTLRRAKKIPQTLRRAEDYAREALKWLLEDGIASSVDVVARWFNDTGLALTITVNQPGNAQRAFAYSWAWDQT